MPNGATHPAAAAAPPLVSADTVLRGVPALGKLPPFVQYIFVMLLTAFGGYVGQGAHGTSAAETEKQNNVIIEKLDSLETTIRALDRRVIKIEAMREAERKPK